MAINIKQIRLLPCGWAGEDLDGSIRGEPFSPNLCNKVEGVIDSLSVCPKVFPTLRDSIQLEYHRGKDYLEFEIYEDKTTCLFICGSIEKEWEIHLSGEELAIYLEGILREWLNV